MTNDIARDKVHHLLENSGVRLAEPREFADWVAGHLQRAEGTQDYSFAPNGMNRVYIATRDIELPELHGALAVTLIVPPGVGVTCRNRGDSRILFMDGFRTEAQDIRIPPQVLAVLSERGLLPEEFIYAEAEALAREMGHARRDEGHEINVEHTLGLISEGIHRVVRPYLVAVPAQKKAGDGRRQE